MTITAATRLPSTTHEEWFEQRRNLVTASEIGKIIKSPAAARRLREEKQTGVKNFHGNKYTQFGQDAEPFLALMVKQQIDSTLIPNDDVWVSKEYPQFGATPDMVSDDGETVGEIKTVKANLDWGEGDIPQRYYDQVQWQIMVMGAEDCVFAWRSYREVASGAFEWVSALQHRVIPYDRKRIAELKRAAERFLAGDDGENIRPDVSPLVRRYLEAKNEISGLRDECDEISAQIRDALGEKPDTYDFPGLGSVTMTKPSKRTTFTSAAFKRDHPEMYSEYTTTKDMPGVIRISAEKKDK